MKIELDTTVLKNNWNQEFICLASRIKSFTTQMFQKEKRTNLQANTPQNATAITTGTEVDKNLSIKAHNVLENNKEAE